MLLTLFLVLPSALRAQQPVIRRDSTAPGFRRDSIPDSVKARLGRSLDTATARRLGLPSAPSRSFSSPDSITDLLLNRRGYTVTRYKSDSATVLPDEKRLLLQGRALAERDSTKLEADSIAYQQSTCTLDAHGSPNLFSEANVLTGLGIRFDTCRRRGVVTDALTDFKEGSTAWFLRGDIAQDSSSSRLFAASSDITSCDLPVPHYYFEAKEVKWTASHFIVARPAVLYVRDVPILWLPFIFQDTRPGRRSGILVPQFGLNDIVRPTPGYSRQFTNIGYYWAPNDYLDLTGKLDWYANRYTTFGILGSYRWLDRFVTGNFQLSRTLNSGGSRGTTIRWNHQQAFNLNTSLNLQLDYSTNTTQLSDNAIDPLLNTRTISSSLNFSRRQRWGTIALGASRRQEITSGQVNMTLPQLSITPKPLDIGRIITWTPAVSITNTVNTGQIQPISVFGPDSVLTDSLRYKSRNTQILIQTPIRIGGFTWSNSVSYADQFTGLQTQTNGLPVINPATGDTSLITRVSNGDFSTGIDWQTGISLPTFLARSWKLQPSVGVSNVASGPMWLRNARSDGQYVSQTKRLILSVSSSPTLFAFFPGFGPLGRIRHSISPVFTYTFNPAADVPLDYAKAAGLTTVVAPQVQSLSVQLNQNLEGKGKPTTTDSAGRKFRILGINTSSLVYDFEQAKLPGRTGWQTQAITNTFQSDLLTGFSLSLQHDLWDGVVGTDSAKFDPFLENVSASFTLGTNTVRGLLRLFGLSHKANSPTSPTQPQNPVQPYPGSMGRPGVFSNTNPLANRAGGRGFSASFSYNLSRTRPVAGALLQTPEQQSIHMSTNFSATPFWSVSLGTQYNITGNRIESLDVRLQRDLHEWRAGFDFTRNANGNFAFYFSIALTDLPQLKFDYNQTTQKTE